MRTSPSGTVISSTRISRRQFLTTMARAGVYLQSGWLLGCGGGDAPQAAVPMVSNLGNLGPLGPVNELQLRLPAGFTVREVAVEGVAPIAGRDYVWHAKPDGGAVFPTPDGGWIYVSNSEVISSGGGGVGALRFDAQGRLIDAYPILSGSTKNCAGGPTPWGSWLSCEEMGRDPFQPRAVVWHDVPNPEPDDRGESEVLLPTRNQVLQATHFDGGEGIWYFERKIYFSTKGDDRLWCYDVDAATVQAIYDARSSADNILSGVDNVVVSAGGDILVCEDPGDGQVVALTPDGRQVPILQLVDSGEPAGPAFTPDGQRLYVSGYGARSGPQRDRNGGATFEIRGPFFVPAPAV